MELKCGRKTYILTEKDLIMFNGACYQLVTRVEPIDHYDVSPIVARNRAEKLIREGKLVLSHKGIKRNVKVEFYKIAR